MIDKNLLRRKTDIVFEKLARRGYNLNIKNFKQLENRRKELQNKLDKFKIEQGSKSKALKYTEIYKNNVLLCNELISLKKEINILNSELNNLKKKIDDFYLDIPNIPADEVPSGTINKEVYKWGNPKNFNFQIRDHAELGRTIGGLDFDTASKITSSRFVIMQGQIALMYRILGQFMMDLHTRKHGYTEVYVPYLVNYRSLYGTGQLPKFSNHLFHILSSEQKNTSSVNSNVTCEMKSNYALIPTAEVPLTNLIYNKTINENELPIKLVACTPCFRSEAGSYGLRDRGLIRMHQFDKVEIVQIVSNRCSMEALETLVSHAEKVLQLLELPYRKMLVCAEKMSFSACKTYDLEVWLPTQNRYCEVSSCSNMWDFQTRRMKAKYRIRSTKRKYLLHTLNGSGLAVGRTLVAILENYQQSDGRILIPKVLSPLMQGLKYIG